MKTKNSNPNERMGTAIEIIEAITAFLARRNLVIAEGSASSEELQYLMGLAQGREAHLVGETGFNAGFSSYAFLRATPEIRVISFDVGEYLYVKHAKEFVDQKFPGRHTLIYGDSKEALPKFAKENPNIRFDLVFIDGGHDYETVKSDIVHLKHLCTEKTAVVIDDLTPWFPWGEGPTQAWMKAIGEGLVMQEELFKDGQRVNTIEPPGERSWALGRYIY